MRAPAMGGQISADIRQLDLQGLAGGQSVFWDSPSIRTYFLKADGGQPLNLLKYWLK